jgi:hypothetical protein
MIALCLIYLMFFLQLYTVRFTYRQFQQWADDEAARRVRWAEDMKAIAAMREEAYHLRAQAEVALALARKQSSAAPVE